METTTTDCLSSTSEFDLISDLSLLQKSESRTTTTSFSQIRQRSVSSYVLGTATSSSTTSSSSSAHHQHQLPPQAPQSHQRASTNNPPPTRKSIGIQHPPPTHCDQSIQAVPPPPPPQTTQLMHSNSPQPPSTIVCMLVATADNPKLNKTDLIRCARLAVRQATASHQINPKRSHSLTVQPGPSKKCSLPDLTFLNKYSSTPASQPQPASRPPNIPQQQQSQTNPVVVAAAPELLKRKTLKSIKRYRQTKQNTEPCGLVAMGVVAAAQQQPTLQQQYSCVESPQPATTRLPPQSPHSSASLHVVNTSNPTSSPDLVKKHLVSVDLKLKTNEIFELLRFGKFLMCFSIQKLTLQANITVLKQFID